MFVSTIISLVAARKAASWSDFVLKKANTDTFSLLFMVTKRKTFLLVIFFPPARRLSMSKEKFYAVAVGLRPGLYATWYVGVALCVS